jgi:S-adenosylmethionine-diacylglycerol 3-amino-3-carboxypropyl transferase
LSGIVFTRAWEDDRLDVAALDISAGDRVLCIAASGDIPLALAAAGASEVVAVDVSAAQLHLLALKIAAAGLDPDERYRWFEVGRVANAAARFRKVLRPRMQATDAAFWDAHVGAFEHDFHRHAGVGRSFARFGSALRLLVPSLRREVEGFIDPEDQQRWWRSHVQPRLFGPITHWLARHTPVLSPLAPNRHELRRMRESGYSVAIAGRIDGVLGRTLVRRHPWWRPAFSGLAADADDGAYWLDRSRAAGVADSATVIRPVQGDLTEVLAGMPVAGFDAVTISNVPDWLDAESGQRLTNALVHAIRPGGRLLVRSILPDGGLPAHPGLLGDPGASKLVEDERTALYGRVELLRRSSQLD